MKPLRKVDVYGLSHTSLLQRGQWGQAAQAVSLLLAAIVVSVVVIVIGFDFALPISLNLDLRDVQQVLPLFPAAAAEGEITGELLKLPLEVVLRLGLGSVLLGDGRNVVGALVLAAGGCSRSGCGRGCRIGTS